MLDNCENESEASMPNAFCSDWLTFRGKGKIEGERGGARGGERRTEADRESARREEREVEGKEE